MNREKKEKYDKLDSGFGISYTKQKCWNLSRRMACHSPRQSAGATAQDSKQRLCHEMVKHQPKHLKLKSNWLGKTAKLY